MTKQELFQQLVTCLNQPNSTAAIWQTPLFQALDEDLCYDAMAAVASRPSQTVTSTDEGRLRSAGELARRLIMKKAFERLRDLDISSAKIQEALMVKVGGDEIPYALNTFYALFAGIHGAGSPSTFQLQHKVELIHRLLIRGKLDLIERLITEGLPRIAVPNIISLSDAGDQLIALLKVMARSSDEIKGQVVPLMRHAQPWLEIDFSDSQTHPVASVILAQTGTIDALTYLNELTTERLEQLRNVNSPSEEDENHVVPERKPPPITPQRNASVRRRAENTAPDNRARSRQRLNFSPHTR